MITLDIPTLSNDELNTIKASRFSFVVRVSSDNTNKLPEEVQILPAITDILLRFSD